MLLRSWGFVILKNNAHTLSTSITATYIIFLLISLLRHNFTITISQVCAAVTSFFFCARNPPISIPILAHLLLLVFVDFLRFSSQPAAALNEAHTYTIDHDSWSSLVSGAFVQPPDDQYLPKKKLQN